MPTVNKDPKYVGVAELAAAMKVTTRRATYLRRTGRLPEATYLHCSFVAWDRDAICRYLAGIKKNAAVKRLQANGERLKAEAEALENYNRLKTMRNSFKYDPCDDFDIGDRMEVAR